MSVVRESGDTTGIYGSETGSLSGITDEGGGLSEGEGMLTAKNREVCDGWLKDLRERERERGVQS